VPTVERGEKGVLVMPTAEEMKEDAVQLRVRRSQTVGAVAP
jgi:hypothetical protein